MGEYKPMGYVGQGTRGDYGRQQHYAMCGNRCHIDGTHFNDRGTIAIFCLLFIGLICTAVILGLMAALFWDIGREGGRASNAFVFYFIIVVIFSLLLLACGFFWFFFAITIRRRVFVIWAIIIVYFVLLMVAIIYYAPVASLLQCDRQRPGYTSLDLPVTYFTTQIFGFNFFAVNDSPIANVSGVQAKTCRQVAAIWGFAIALAIVLIFASIGPCCVFCGDNGITGREKSSGGDDEESGGGSDGGDDVNSVVSAGESRPAAPGK